MPDCEKCVYKAQLEQIAEPAFADYDRAHAHARKLLLTRGGPLKEGRLRIVRHFNGIVHDLQRAIQVPCGEDFDECQVAAAAIDRLIEPYNNTPEHITKNI